MITLILFKRASEAISDAANGEKNSERIMRRFINCQLIKSILIFSEIDDGNYNNNPEKEFVTSIGIEVLRRNIL